MERRRDRERGRERRKSLHPPRELLQTFSKNFLFLHGHDGGNKERAVHETKIEFSRSSKFSRNFQSCMPLDMYKFAYRKSYSNFVS